MPLPVVAEPVEGIAGWLMLPAISLVFSPVMTTVNLFLGWNMMEAVAPEYLSDPRFWTVCMIEVGMIAASLWVAVLFFRKRRGAVRAVIVLLLAAVAAKVGESLLNGSMFGVEAREIGTAALRGAVPAALWIPYFLKSKRVRNTFTG